MKSKILSIDGEKVKDIELPKFFSERIRNDIVEKVLEAKKTKQPYSPSPVGGKQHSASGKISHRRHVWKGHYGKGISRVPRKIMSRKGSQFNWVAAEVSSARGGRRAHPPKILHMLTRKKINKKELNIAIKSALSATADGKEISRKYSRLKNEKITEVPFIVESKLAVLKAKELISSLRKILGEKLFDVALKKKSVRSGKGKLRGRKYKSNAGLLIIIGKNEKLKTGAFDVADSNNLSVNDLAEGGTGRLTVYTESAIKELGEKLK